MDGDCEGGGNYAAAEVFMADNEKRRKMFENFVNSLRHKGQFSLAADIDKCMKKVLEGVETFEDIYEKAQNTSNPNHKEKLETELKKETQKLQRLRDQMKLWSTSGKMKDTSLLDKTRKFIQSLMQRFKVMQHEVKTKAFSNEGLEAAQKVDQTTRDQEELKNWLVATIEQFHIQVDQMESEFELIMAGKRKKLDKDKVERIDELKSILERHGFHIRKLETVLRILDNITIDIDALKKFLEKVNQIRDDVEYYLESNQEPDFEVNEYLYDDIDGLEEFNVIAQPNALANLRLNSAEQEGKEEDDEEEVYGTPMCNSSGSCSPVLCIHSRKNGSDLMNDTESFAGSSKDGRSVLTNISPNVGATSTEVGATPTPNPFVSLSFLSAKTIPLSASPNIGYTDCAELNNWLTRPGSTAAELALIPTVTNGSLANSDSSSMDGASTSGTVGSDKDQTNKHVSSSQKSVWTNYKADSKDEVEEKSLMASSSRDEMSKDSGSSSAARELGTINSELSRPRPLVDSSYSWNGISSSKSSRQCPNHTPFSQNPALWRIGPPKSTKPCPNRPLRFAANGVCVPRFSAPNYWPVVMIPVAGHSLPQHVKMVASTSSTNMGSILKSSSVPCPIHNYPISDRFLTTTAAIPLVQHRMEERRDPAENMNEIQHTFQGMSQQDQKLLLRILRDEKASATLKALAKNILHRNGIEIYYSDETETQDAQDATFTVLQSVAPLGAPLSNEHQFQLQMLECAHDHLPIAVDSEMMSQFLPTNCIETPSYYPQHPVTDVDSLYYLRQLPAEALFYIFYYKEGTEAQLMAAKVLKERFWCFHTKYFMWFKRVCKPDVQTADFEMGTYLYFDIELWEQKTKDRFIFKYEYLENINLS